MSARNVKAGGAFVEIFAKDKTGSGLARAQTRLAVFAKSVKALSTTLAGGLRAIGKGMTYVGTAVAAAGGGILAAMAASVKTFLDVSKRAAELGQTIAGLDPSKAERLSAAIETLKAVWGAIQFRLGEAIAEPLTKLLMVLIKLGTVAANFIKNNQALVVIIAAVAAVVTVAFVAFAALGVAITVMASAVAGAAAILSAIATPVGIAVALVAALAVAALLMGAAFLAAAEMSTGAISGIVAALASGDILKAWGIITKGMEVAWQATMTFMQLALNAVIKSIGGAFRIFAQSLARDLKRAEELTGLNLGSAAVGALGAGTGAATAVGADIGNSTASAELARAMAELAGMSAEARDRFMQAFASVGFSLPDLGQITNRGNRQGFGVTGTTNSTTAGQARTLGGIEKEQKKSNEYLENILKVLKNTEVKGELEFAP